MSYAAPVQTQPYGINANPNQPSAPTASQAGGAIPFAFAAKRLEVEGNTYSAVAFGGSFNSPVPAEGYIESVEIDVNGTGGVNGSVTVTASADAPWNSISSVIFSDARGTQIHTLDGYAAYLVQRYFGGSNFAVENDTNSFTAVSTGASGTGNFAIKAKLPVMYRPDGAGCLPNSNQSAAYKIATKFNSSATFYGTTAPGTPPTLSGLVRLLGRIIPPATDVYGRAQSTTPPIYKSYMVTESETVPGGNVAGTNTYYLARVGNPYKGIMGVWRDSSGSRSGAVSSGFFPTSLTLQIDTFVKINNLQVSALAKRVYEKTGLIVPAGVVVLPFDREILEGLVVDYEDIMTTLAGTSAKLAWQSASAGGSTQWITLDIVSPDGGLAVTANNGMSPA